MRIIDGYTVLGPEADGLAADELLRSMDENGIERAVLCPDSRSAALYNEAGNELVLDAVKRNPNRFIGFATVSPWAKNGAELLEAALAAGCRGAYFSPVVQGVLSDDPLFYPLLEVCRRHGAPVHIKSGTPINAMPFHVLSLARRFPGVNFILGQSGANDLLSDGLDAARLADNIYLDISLNLSRTMRNVGAEMPHKMIFGSAAPRTTQRFALDTLRVADLPQNTLEAVLAGNLLKLLGEGASA